MQHLEEKADADVQHLEEKEDADIHRLENKQDAAFGRQAGRTWCVSSDVVVMGNSGRCRATSASTHPRDHTSIPVPHALPVNACTGHTGNEHSLFVDTKHTCSYTVM